MRRSCGSTGCNFKYSAKTWSPWKLRAARDNIRGRLPRIPSTQGPSRTASMQALTGLAPLVAFFVTYRLRGLYVATAVLMAAMVALLALDWLRQRRVPPLHALSAMLVLILGAATLLLHNRLFIQWKPTLLFWAVSGAFIASFWIGERTLTQRLLGAALEERLRVSAPLWRRLDLGAAAVVAALGAVHLAVAHYATLC